MSIFQMWLVTMGTMLLLILGYEGAKYYYGQHKEACSPWSGPAKDDHSTLEEVSNYELRVCYEYELKNTKVETR